MKAFGQFWDYITTADNWEGKRGLYRLLLAHIRISAMAVVVSVAVAVPIGLALGHVRRGGVVVNAVINIGRAVPTFAIIALLFPISLGLGFQLGFVPTLAAMVLLATPPIFTNTYAGIVGVDRGVVEAARGMGLRSRQVLWKVEAPNALPLIVTGVRVAAVQVVATATLGALVGYSDLGTPIVLGLSATRDKGALLTGAVLVAVLAILVEIAFTYAERAATPWIARSRRHKTLVDDLVQLPVPAKGFP